MDEYVTKLFLEISEEFAVKIRKTGKTTYTVTLLDLQKALLEGVPVEEVQQIFTDLKASYSGRQKPD
ncbi:MAG: hypothetical protein HQM11_07405 [SAR324 cluster bacterium]|nr:hypothetical protein [SAR324 cluster bacterium]